MFGGHPGPWDARKPWNGWWGVNPPFHHPVFVLTHHARKTLELEGGTTFTFVTDWGSPPTFACVGAGEHEIFLCQDAQGGRRRGDPAALSGFEGSDVADQGAWISIMVDDVDAIHKHCLEQKLEITWPPTDVAWGAREMHLRHPDGHVFRISQEIEDAE